MPGKSKLTADAGERAALRNLSKSEHRGEADRARAILLTLAGQRADEIRVLQVRDIRDRHGLKLSLCYVAMGPKREEKAKRPRK